MTSGGGDPGGGVAVLSDCSFSLSTGGGDSGLGGFQTFLSRHVFQLNPSGG